MFPGGPRVLVTGATGLLGRVVRREFQTSGWSVVGTGYRRARPHLLRCDLTDEDAVRGLLHEYQVVLQIVLHMLIDPESQTIRPDLSYVYFVVVQKLFPENAIKTKNFYLSNKGTKIFSLFTEQLYEI